MIKWLNNFTSSNGENVVLDYQNVTCHSGKMIGKSIYLLKEVEMGCISNKMTLWGKVGVGVGTAAILILLVGIVLSKRKREVKFLMYSYLKFESFLDEDENWEGMEYDAFFCYW